MRKSFYFWASALFISTGLNAQIRVALVGGAHQSSVIETNNLSNWDSIKNNYKERFGVHLGIVADMPLGQHSPLSFQPGIVFYNKGRKYEQRYDTTVTTLFVKTSTQYINYIDVPLNLVLRFGKKTKLMIGGGPYISLFFSGKETYQLFAVNGLQESSETNDPPVGKKPGQYQVLHYGVNGLAGVERGRVFLTANYSRGLNDFYQAIDYTGSFKHQVIGVTLGVYIGKPVAIENKIKDKDKDGITDELDACPNDPGTAITKGCPDKDGDGIADKDDKCPDTPGTLNNNGCPIPDRDKDGINDIEDKCPDQPGTTKYNGCPVPDTDKDGINDEEDKCPAQAGLARYNGCPIPDRDGDGVNDEADKCPDVKGTPENNGCEEIRKEIIDKVNYAAKRILFRSAKSDLLPESYKVLDEVVSILNDNPELKLSIEGHTSGDGNLAANMKLSGERATIVKNYLESKGINSSRLTAEGFGPTRPLNNGKTAAEKALNRRVELKLSND